MGKLVVLDVDPGIDDALALIMALRSEELEVSAITTVFGNLSLKKTTLNVLKVLELLKAEVTVARGMARPLKGRRIDAQSIHGKDGLGGATLPVGRMKPGKIRAPDLIIEQALSTGRRSLTIISTAPLTNIASALMKEPEVAKKVDRLISMGGAFGLTRYGYGNQTPVAEFNIYSDPEAANIVYHSGISITAVGLDVTMNPEACLRKEHYAEMQRADTETARFAVEATRSLMERFGYVALHDPLTVAVAVDLTLVRTKPFYVDIETKGELTRGQTVVERRSWIMPRKKPNVDICVSVEGKRFLDLFMDRVIRK
ncbi:MAG: nucleoside hydrolase [Candidatus Bathyarchaeia archaeon]